MAPSLRNVALNEMDTRKKHNLCCYFITFSIDQISKPFLPTLTKAAGNHPCIPLQLPHHQSLSNVSRTSMTSPARKASSSGSIATWSQTASARIATSSSIVCSSDFFLSVNEATEDSESDIISSSDVPALPSCSSSDSTLPPGNLTPVPG